MRNQQSDIGKQLSRAHQLQHEMLRGNLIQKDPRFLEKEYFKVCDELEKTGYCAESVMLQNWYEELIGSCPR